MKQRKQLSIDNFGIGLNRDGAMSRDKMQSLRVMKNYKIIYTDGRLQMRPGYERWNDTELDTPATQLFWFADLEGNENLLGIQGDIKQWNAIKESGAHVVLDGFIATARRPITQFGGRVFYGANNVGTGAPWRWTDNDSIDGAGPYSYRAGIKKPTESPNMYLVGAQGAGLGGGPLSWDLVINTTTRRKVAMEITVTTRQLKVKVVTVSMAKVGSGGTGSVRVKIYTDDGGEPSSTLVDDNAVSAWQLVRNFAAVNGNNEIIFPFSDSFYLEAETKYWIELEGDTAYYSTFNGVAGDTAFYAVVLSRLIPPVSPDYAYGPSLEWNANTSTWNENVLNEGIFRIGYLEKDKYYDYVFTYYNSTHGIESRKSPYARIQATEWKDIRFGGYVYSLDNNQVDKIRIYRRKLADGEDADNVDDDVADPYKFVAEIDHGVPIAFSDSIPTTYLGAELQTDDHFCIDDVSDDEGEIRQTALVPHVAVLWKGRIWFVEEDGNILYMSKKLEEDGATGLTGGLIPDFFPLDNQLEIASSSKILALRVLPADQLAIYTNTNIWVISGADDNRNPPSDMSPKKMIADIGIVAPAALGSTKNQQVFLAREGLYAYKGTLSREYLSANVQSIFDDIEDQYIDDSIIATLGDEVWLLVDADNDGSLESIYILDLQRKPVTWRVYDYGVNLNDIVARTTGTEYKTLLAADADNNYVLQLDSGTDDNGVPIVAELETQDIRIPKKASVYMVELDAYYPNVPSVYEITVRDHVGLEKSYMIQPNGADDIAGHRTGCLLSATPTMRIKIVQRSVNEDQLLGFKIGYVTK